MHEFILRAIEQGGLLGIFLLMAVENIFPPIPSEVIMGLGGVAVSRGTMDFWP
ncbi:MAG: DedA family protein, partial [Qipengyuania citrea]